MDRWEEGTDPAFAGLSEEELLGLAQQGNWRAANALTMHYYEEIRELVARLAQRAGLQAADAEDAQQQVLVAVRLAIPRYRPARDDVSRPCSLRTHLHQVATRRFHNVLKRGCWVRRREREMWLAAAQAAQPSAAPGAADWLCPPPEWKDEPCLAAQRQEALAALPAALSGLGETERRLGQGVLDGTPQCVLAPQLGLVAYVVGRLWHKILAALQGRLRKY